MPDQEIGSGGGNKNKNEAVWWLRCTAADTQFQFLQREAVRQNNLGGGSADRV